ncbi:MAG: trypsin-like peptidase domain-containing protein [Thiomargarita sp.]|nr:trypsin-like peptidase domain-containing protein [Thiomargarita sp.]
MTQFIKFLSLLLIPITCLAASPDFEQIDESVVLIINDTSEGQNTGTGFVINDQQNVITNYHVVAGSINLSIADGGIDDVHLKAAQVISVSEEKDLAILYVPNLHRPPIPLTKIEPKKGTPVYAIGFPGAANLLTRTLSTESSIHEGIVGRIIDAAWEENKPLFRIIQHDSEINGGNSGGPLVNRCLQVVGINTVKTSFLASLARGEIIAGLYFASHISLLIRRIKRSKYPIQCGQYRLHRLQWHRKLAHHYCGYSRFTRDYPHFNSPSSANYSSRRNLQSTTTT